MMLARLTKASQAASMWRLLSIVGLLCLGAQPALAVGQAASSKWTVDYADDHCQASRTFDIDGRAVLLVIKPPLDGGTTRLQVHKAFRELSGPEPAVSLDFGDGQPPFRTTMHLALSLGGVAMIVDLPPAEAVRLRSASMLKLKSATKVRGEFALAPGAALFRALDRCVADLRTRLGLDSGPPRWTVQATSLTALKPLFSSSKFWTVEMRKPRTNKVTVRLLVDKAGAVRDCAITAGSGSTGLDIQTCQVFERHVKYRPARAADGEPVATMVTETIDWRL